MAVIVRGRALTPFRGYTEFAAQSWALILTLGLFFGWFLSFPLLGPILGRVTADRGTDPMALVLSFLAAHAMGLVAAGGLAYCDRRALTLFPLSLLPCIVLTFSVQGVPVATWPALFAIMGFFSAPVVIACADAFVASVPPSRRGHVLALGVALANLLVYLITLASRWAAAPSLVATAALLLTGAVLAIDHSRRQIAVAAQGPAVIDLAETGGEVDSLHLDPLLLQDPRGEGAVEPTGDQSQRLHPRAPDLTVHVRSPPSGPEGRGLPPGLPCGRGRRAHGTGRTGACR